MNPTYDVKDKLKDLIDTLEKLFSDPLIKYDITYCKQSYKFTDPIYEEDKDLLAKQRQQLIKAMTKKAISKYIDNYYKYKNFDEDYSDPSFNFISDMITMHPTNLAISVPVGEKYEVGIDEIDRSLDLERVEEDEYMPMTDTVIHKKGSLFLKDQRIVNVGLKMQKNYVKVFVEKK